MAENEIDWHAKYTELWNQMFFNVPAVHLLQRVYKLHPLRGENIVPSETTLKERVKVFNDVKRFLEAYKRLELKQSQRSARNENTKYTYYRIEFKDWSGEYDYTIVETLDDVRSYLEIADTDLDDPEMETKVIVTGVGMTPLEYDKWMADNIENFDK